MQGPSGLGVDIPGDRHACESRRQGIKRTMSWVVLGSQAPANHVVCCPLAAWFPDELAAKVSTSFRPIGSWVNLISSSSRYLAHLSVKAKWFLESPGSKGPVAPSGPSRLESNVNKPLRKPRPLASKSPPAPWFLGQSASSLESCVGPQVPWPHVLKGAGDLGGWAPSTTLETGSLGPTLSREQGDLGDPAPSTTLETGSLGPRLSRDQGDLGDEESGGLGVFPATPGVARGFLVWPLQGQKRRGKWAREPAGVSPTSGAGGAPKGAGRGPQFVPRPGTTLWHM
jgi:hypothetical protein